jgi:hypothetical protein
MDSSQSCRWLPFSGPSPGLNLLELQDASQIPAIVEPWMLAFNASIELSPVMVLDDPDRAGSAFEKAVKSFG